MEFGIGIATSGESWKRAEQRGITPARSGGTRMRTADGGDAHAVADPARVRRAFA